MTIKEKQSLQDMIDKKTVAPGDANKMAQRWLKTADDWKREICYTDTVPKWISKEYFYCGAGLPGVVFLSKMRDDMISRCGVK